MQMTGGVNMKRVLNINRMKPIKKDWRDTKQEECWLREVDKDEKKLVTQKSKNQTTANASFTKKKKRAPQNFSRS